MLTFEKPDLVYGIPGDVAYLPTIAAKIRRKIKQGGERVWRLEDFRDLPFTAVAQALSRLIAKERLNAEQGDLL